MVRIELIKKDSRIKQQDILYVKSINDFFFIFNYKFIKYQNLRNDDSQEFCCRNFLIHFIMPHILIKYPIKGPIQIHPIFINSEVVVELEA